MTPQPVLRVCNVLLSQQGELLLGLTPHLQWGVPVGEVSPDGSIPSARRAHRLVSGMDLKGDPRLIGTSEGIDEVTGELVCWLVYLWSVWEGFPQVVDEHGPYMKWRWFPLQDLPAASKLEGPTLDLLFNILPSHLAEKEGGVDDAD